MKSRGSTSSGSAAKIRGYRAFPRAAGMLCGAAALVLTGDPLAGLVVFLAVWFLIWFFLRMLPLNIVDTRLWAVVSLPVTRIGQRPIRRALYVAAVVLALSLGAPLLLTALLMGSVLVCDVVMHMRGS